MKDSKDYSKFSVGKKQMRHWSPVWCGGRNIEQQSQKLCQAIEQVSERQELLAALMESKKSLQKEAREEFHRQIFQEFKELQEQKSKESLELLGEKHRLERLKKERGRARFLEGKELLAAATADGSFRSLCPLVEPGTNAEMSTPSRAQSPHRETAWWNADL